MPGEEFIFKHPPAAVVLLGVTFRNTLEVADDRSRFHNLIRAEFPTVVMPEQSKTTFDLGDYTLFTEDTGDRLEIGMNYFRLASTRYPGFDKFRSLFLSSLGIFSKSYALGAFTGLAMIYGNALPMEAHHKFGDCFTLGVRLPEDSQSELFAGKGFLMFQKPEGFISIELDPQFGDSRIKSYTMNLAFTAAPGTAINADESSLGERVDTAHAYLKKLFFGILTKQYLEYLRSK